MDVLKKKPQEPRSNIEKEILPDAEVCGRTDKKKILADANDTKNYGLMDTSAKKKHRKMRTFVDARTFFIKLPYNIYIKITCIKNLI